jgi:hypothetical protein
VDTNTGQSGHAIGHFSQIGNFNVDYHRQLPDTADITEVILTKQTTDNRQQTTDNRRQATDDRRQATGR